MKNIELNWRELKIKILNSAMEGKEYVLNFWEKEGIVKPYSMLVLNNTSCDITLDRDIFDNNLNFCGHIHINMQDLVFSK